MTVEEILDMYDDPDAYFTDPNRKVSKLYKEHSLNQLKKEFRFLSACVITKVYQQVRFLTLTWSFYCFCEGETNLMPTFLTVQRPVRPVGARSKELQGQGREKEDPAP